MSFITYVIMTSVHYVIMASVPLLLCLLHTLSIMSSVHSVCHFGFFYVNYFYHLTILSIIVNIEFAGNIPFLSRSFRQLFVSIK